MDLSSIQNKVQKSFDGQAFIHLLGAKLESVEKGRVVVSCDNREDLTQQLGFLHGGVIATVADVSCGYAALSTLPEDAEVLTVEFKINILRPARTRRIRATGQVLKTGKTLVTAEATVTDDTGEILIARLVATIFAIKQPPGSDGRA